jgi:hypothetical protein
MCTKSLWARICAVLGCAALMTAAPVMAAKPGSGGSGGDPCATAGAFPSFIYGLTTVAAKGASSVKIRLADETGKCSRDLATVPGVERLPLLIDLGDGEWRAVWTAGDNVSSELDGIVVLDFTVSESSTGPQVNVLATDRITTGRVVGLEAASGGNALFLVPTGIGSTPGSLWSLTIDRDNAGPMTMQVAQIRTVSQCGFFDLAVGPDGDSLYFAAPRADGSTGTVVYRLSLAALGDDSATCGELVLDEAGGNTVQLAAGLCPGGQVTCLALQRHNVQGIPCTPDYYRTDVFRLGTTSRTTLPLAYSSWGSAGTLLGRRTGSTSKNACTAKIYEEMVRYTLNQDLSSGPAIPVGTGRTLDAPNPIQ